jgi:hypothetical protein
MVLTKTMSCFLARSSSVIMLGTLCHSEGVILFRKWHHVARVDTCYWEK